MKLMKCISEVISNAVHEVFAKSGLCRKRPLGHFIFKFWVNNKSN